MFIMLVLLVELFIIFNWHCVGLICFGILVELDILFQMYCVGFWLKIEQTVLLVWPIFIMLA